MTKDEWRDELCPAPNNVRVESGHDTILESDGRKHSVHLPVYERHNLPLIIFLTVCAKAKKRIFDKAAAQAVLVNSWYAGSAWLVGRYVIMLDHIHLFCAPAEAAIVPLQKWVRFWKSLAAQRWPVRNDLPVWLRHFWDTQPRRHESYIEKWNYLRQNPVRAGLTAQSDDWPYQGS